MPAPTTSNEDTTHQQLLDTIDLALKPKTFRNPSWKPSQRRNKNIKQIVSEASRKEASVLATQNNSGATTPNLANHTNTNANNANNNNNNTSSALNTGGSATPLPPQSTTDCPAATQTNISQAAQNLSTMVLERNLQASLSAHTGPSFSSTSPAGTGAGVGSGGGGPAVMVATYTNIESAPSLHPGEKKHYCDITGLPASYTDPKTRLRYCNKEIFDVVRGLPQGVAEKYLEARGAHVILK